VPVLQVASVAASIRWYRAAFGFTAAPVGPPDDPVFAILSRDGVEVMLQKGRAAPLTGLGMSVYLRVADVAAIREAVLAVAPAGEIESREYGCREFRVSDPDGNVLVVSQRS